MSNRFFPNYPSYIVTSRFGMRDHPVDGVYKMHNGVDIVATADGKNGQADKIKAHTGGIVDAVGYSDTVGYYINIRVDASTVMAYRHLRDMPSLKKGEAVNAGDIIGIMGKTGKATARHLHWGIKVDGKWIDPAPYLDEDYPVVTTYGTVTYKYLRIRKGAGTNYPEVGQLKLGDRVEILETKAVGSTTWGRIDRGWICITGYVELETVTKQPEEQEGDTVTVRLRILRRGCKGEDVKALQAMLVGFGYSIAEDGSYGAKTENAVECYQEDSKLPVTGCADHATWNSLHGQ